MSENPKIVYPVTAYPVDQATLSRLENGRQPNPTIDTLWRYASAIGRRLVLTHANAQLPERRNGKAIRS